MACHTLYQIFNFLARNNGRISLAPHPDDPCKNRCAIKVGSGEEEVIVGVEYDCTEERDLVQMFLSRVCTVLQEDIEKD